MGCSNTSLSSQTAKDGRDVESLDENRPTRLSFDDDETEGENSPKRDASNVGMATAAFNPQDLLNEQRRLSTDVTSKLKNRWQKSHFAKDLVEDEKIGKRRQILRCSNVSQDCSMSSSLVTHCLPNNDHYDNDVSN